MEDDMADDFLHLFAATFKTMRAIMTATLHEHGVYPGQDLVLQVLWRADGLTPGDVAERLGLTVPTVVKMAQRMESNGLVSRIRDDKDGRLVRIYLTSRGRQLEEPVMRNQAWIGTEATAGLTAEDHKALISALTNVLGNLRAARSRLEGDAKSALQERS
jgi:DNA-binding MarR family transcriptional regulator